MDVEEYCIEQSFKIVANLLYISCFGPNIKLSSFDDVTTNIIT
jgi:hypothetical protein